MAEATLQELQQELQQINEQRQEVTVRLHQMGPIRGRGRGRGRMQGSHGDSDSAGRPSVLSRLGPAQAPDDAPRPSGLANAPRHVARRDANGTAGVPDMPPDDRNMMHDPWRDRGGPRRPRPQPPQQQQQALQSAGSSGIQEAGSRKRMLSAVVVNGETVVPKVEAEEQEDGRTKRRRLADENPDVKKRNRNMFGLLTRTLQACQQESNTFRESSVAKKRREAEERAAAAKRELAVDARRAAAQQAATKRQAEQATAAALQQLQPASVTLLASKELSVKRELEVRADIKRAEILYTQRVQSRARLALFIHTKARPGLCWLPARHAEETLKLLEEEQQRLEEYKTEEKGRLNAHKQGLINKVAELQEARNRPAPQVQPPRPALRSMVQVADDTREPAQQEEAAPAEDRAPPGLEPMAEDVDEGAYVVDEEEVQAELERQEREEQAAAEAEGGDEADGQSSRQAQLAAQPQDFGR
eukprot:jgi/Astpho2/1162/Aster-x0467